MDRSANIGAAQTGPSLIANFSSPLADTKLSHACIIQPASSDHENKPSSDLYCLYGLWSISAPVGATINISGATLQRGKGIHRCECGPFPSWFRETGRVSPVSTVV